MVDLGAKFELVRDPFSRLGQQGPGGGGLDRRSPAPAALPARRAPHGNHPGPVIERQPAPRGRPPAPFWPGPTRRRRRVPTCGATTPLFPVLQIRDIGSGNFGVAKLCRDKENGELVAVKFIERGEKARREERRRAGACGGSRVACCAREPHRASRPAAAACR